MSTKTKTARIPRNPETIDWNSRVNSILSSNAKLLKTPSGVDALNEGVSLAPAKRSGVANVCEFATAACIAACVLWFAGRTVTAVVRAAAIARTMLLTFSPAVFYARLRRELQGLADRAAAIGARAFCRLNVASDVEHPREIMAEFPAVTFYDYTKSVERVLRYLVGEFPANYSLSYSVHESSTFADVSAILGRGGNVVLVVDSYYWGPSKRYGTLPAAVTFTGPAGERITVPAVDGDVSDIRTPEFDGRGVAVCLRLKSQSNRVKAAARKSGFARPWSLGGKEHSSRHAFPAARGNLVARLA